MTRSYLTVARDAEAEYVDRRSVFRCRLVRVETEEAARAVVEAARKEHWDARHHCSAFVLGPAAALQRSSDDGEPAGTAGAPMLEVLRGRELSDVVAVVTRWFGGTLLGAGGLVRAYGEAVRLAAEEAGTLRRSLRQEYEVGLDPAVAGRIEGELRARGVAVLETRWEREVTLRLADPGDSMRALLAELTGGVAVVVPVGESWVDSPTGRSESG